MKNLRSLLLLFSLVFLASNASAQNLSKLDEKNGFRDAIFGTPFSSFKNMVLDQADAAGTTKVYTRSTDNLKIGDYELKDIHYFFYKDTLYGVSVSTRGYTNSRGFLDILSIQYGKGSQSNRYIEKYSWHSKNILMVYDENSVSNDAIIHIMSLPIMDQKDKNEKAAASKAASEL